MNREINMCSNDQDPDMWPDIIKFIFILTFFSVAGILIDHLRERDNEQGQNEYFSQHYYYHYANNISVMHTRYNGV